MSLMVCKQQSKENLKSESDMKFVGGHYSWLRFSGPIIMFGLSLLSFNLLRRGCN